MNDLQAAKNFKYFYQTKKWLEQEIFKTVVTEIARVHLQKVVKSCFDKKHPTNIFWKRKFEIVQHSYSKTFDLLTSRRICWSGFIVVQPMNYHFFSFFRKMLSWNTDRWENSNLLLGFCLHQEVSPVNNTIQNIREKLKILGYWKLWNTILN